MLGLADIYRYLPSLKTRPFPSLRRLSPYNATVSYLHLQYLSIASTQYILPTTTTSAIILYCTIHTDALHTTSPQDTLYPFVLYTYIQTPTTAANVR